MYARECAIYHANCIIFWRNCNVHVPKEMKKYCTSLCPEAFIFFSRCCCSSGIKNGPSALSVMFKMLNTHTHAHMICPTGRILKAVSEVDVRAKTPTSNQHRQQPLEQHARMAHIKRWPSLCHCHSLQRRPAAAHHLQRQ